MEKEVLKRFTLSMERKNDREDKEIKSEVLARMKKDRKKEKKRTLKSILRFCQLVGVCFQLPCVLALPLYYYFSVSIVLLRCSSRELGCHGRLRLFSPDSLPPSCPGSVLVYDDASARGIWRERPDAALFISKFTQPDAN